MCVDLVFPLNQNSAKSFILCLFVVDRRVKMKWNRNTERIQERHTLTIHKHTEKMRETVKQENWKKVGSIRNPNQASQS